MPVTQDSVNLNPPKILTIAFFSQNYTANGVSGLLQTLSVYRLYGAGVTRAINTAGIPTINSLARNSGGTGATPDISLSSSFATSGGFSSSLNTTNMYSSPTNNTITFGNSDGTAAFGSYFGAGYTITSFFFNIFAGSTLSWAQPPANTATTCTTFGYVYNTGAVYKSGQWIYVAFCPIDSSFVIHSSAANIIFLNPQYPSYFTNGYPLRSVLTIAYSDQNGYLKAYRQ